jgi:hypothetical protein
MTDKRPDRPGDGFRAASTLNVVAGIWLIISPWVLGDFWPPVARSNSVLVGIGVLIVAAIRLTMPRTTVLSWINFLLGMWLLFSPFLLSYSVVSTATGNAMIIGCLILLFGLGAAHAPQNTAPSLRRKG